MTTTKTCPTCGHSETQHPGEYVRPSDVARMAGVTPATVTNWTRRHADFPAPVGRTNRGPVFLRSEVARWLDARPNVAGVTFRVIRGRVVPI